MTKRRPSNKKPTGINTSLGSSLANERRKARSNHILSKFHEDGYAGEALANSNLKKNAVKSITEESSLEEFLAKVDLAKTDFTAERDSVKFIEQSTSSVVPTKHDVINSLELQQQYAQRLKIPRRPIKSSWNSAEELNDLERENFLQWRRDIAELQQVDGLVLTPFERNLELWRQLWRVVEQSDIVVQIVDARNPLLFRNADLEKYVKECDPAKKNIILVNKTDLLTREQIKLWSEYFTMMGIDAVFWSALNSVNAAESLNGLNKVIEVGSKSDHRCSSAEDNTHEIPFLCNATELVNLFKSRVELPSSGGENCRRIVVGMVGYPNVGKSSTINGILGKKKVSVSSTPGKTRHLQTLIVDEELTICDCPGLVMPSFALNRDVMLLNGILSADQMRECFGPIGLLATRIPRKCFELMYSVMLPPPAEHENPNRPPTAHEVLTSVAFMKGFMSAAGIPDCSRAARLIIKDVANGKVKWIAAPPNISQEEFDKYTYGKFLKDGEDKSSKKKGNALLQQLEKRHLLCSTDVTVKTVDEQFFSLSQSEAHIIPSNAMCSKNYKCYSGSGKMFLKKCKKEKLRRLYSHLDA